MIDVFHKREPKTYSKRLNTIKNDMNRLNSIEQRQIKQIIKSSIALCKQIEWIFNVFYHTHVKLQIHANK